jgi:DNA-directed RNA polymerase specialized sigma24 family protein
MSWGYRLAAVLYQVKFASDPEGFGRLVYGMFLMLRVTGMPPTPLVPSTSREIDRLPRGYGHDFGLASRALARRFFTDEGEVDDLLSVVGLKVLSDTSLHRGLAGKPISEAKSYVFKTIANQARDMLRSQRVRQHDVLDDLVGDPASWTSLGRHIPERETDQIKRELEAVVSPRLLPDLPLYFDLLLDGHSNAEIAEKRLLPSLRLQRPQKPDPFAANSEIQSWSTWPHSWGQIVIHRARG